MGLSSINKSTFPLDLGFKPIEVIQDGHIRIYPKYDWLFRTINCEFIQNSQEQFDAWKLN